MPVSGVVLPTTVARVGNIGTVWATDWDPVMILSLSDTTLCHNRFYRSYRFRQGLFRPVHWILTAVYQPYGFQTGIKSSVYLQLL